MKLRDLMKLTKQFSYPATREDMERMQDYLRRLGYDPDNFYQELEMSSRFVDTHQDTSFSNARVSLHSHSFYEVIYCRSAEDVEYLVGSDRYRLQKGDIVFVSPGTGHRPLLPEKMSVPYCRDVLWLSTEFVESLSRIFPDSEFQGKTYSSLLRRQAPGGSIWGTFSARASRRRNGRCPVGKRWSLPMP